MRRDVTDRRRIVILGAVLAACGVGFGALLLSHRPAAGPVTALLGPVYAIAAQPKPVDTAACFGCHDEIKQFHSRGKHTRVNCSTCHADLDRHLQSPDQKPITRTDHAACGGCHKSQHDSFMMVTLESRAKIEKATFKSRSPLFDKLSTPHGFTKEHDEPRSHVFMLLDHLIVDRAYGGRFQLGDWKKIQDGKAVQRNVWDTLTDKEPGSGDQKVFLPQTAIAANPVCLSCKTQDHILDWKYLGEPDPRAKWSRISKVVEFVRELRHPVNCFACHDPHSAEPRVVRDALIQAVVDRSEGTYPYDQTKSRQVTMRKVVFRDFRAIGVLSKPDSNVMCAQCHVEYNCNPGIDPNAGQPVTMADRRTNYFPWVNVFDLKKKYDDLSFKDFRHATTGALLTKLQHPETETFWGSAHERAGLECKHCHMPKVKDKAGKAYTWHGQRSARYMKRDTCVRCHTYWTEAQADYEIDAIQNYIRGKITKAEFWLGQLIDRYSEAKGAGIPEDVLRKAREAHDQAHIYWEWWTAENSDGFHNPTAARESLARSVTISQDAIKALDEALARARAK
jgi:formate-dependent nitrite reductase cytochrome c552 subunit